MLEKFHLGGQRLDTFYCLFSDKPHITTHFLLNVDLQSPLKQSLEIPPSFSQMQKSAQLVLRVIAARLKQIQIDTLPVVYLK